MRVTYLLISSVRDRCTINTQLNTWARRVYRQYTTQCQQRETHLYHAVGRRPPYLVGADTATFAQLPIAPFVEEQHDLAKHMLPHEANLRAIPHTDALRILFLRVHPFVGLSLVQEKNVS